MVVPLIAHKEPEELGHVVRHEGMLVTGQHHGIGNVELVDCRLDRGPAVIEHLREIAEPRPEHDSPIAHRMVDVVDLIELRTESDQESFVEIPQVPVVVVQAISIIPVIGQYFSIHY